MKSGFVYLMLIGAFVMVTYVDAANAVDKQKCLNVCEASKLDCRAKCSGGGYNACINTCKKYNAKCRSYCKQKRGLGDDDESDVIEDVDDMLDDLDDLFPIV